MCCQRCSRGLCGVRQKLHSDIGRLRDFGDFRSLTNSGLTFHSLPCSGTVYVVAHADDDLLVSFLQPSTAFATADLFPTISSNRPTSLPTCRAAHASPLSSSVLENLVPPATPTTVHASLETRPLPRKWPALPIPTPNSAPSSVASLPSFAL